MDLRIRNVSKTYANGVRALTNVTLTVPTGMYGLLGPNGAGKSTLMRILATLQEPDEGTVRLDDLDVLNQKDEVRQTLGYLPQSFGFHPRVRAERLLDHFAVLKGISAPGTRRDVVRSLLRQVNLWDARAQKVGTFSGGMRQRLGVAVALLGNPKLIIVDEPTAGLDPAERVRFLNLLSEIGEDSAVILSTHIVEDVEELCSRMAIIDRGEILLEAEPTRAVEDLRGRIWRRAVSRDELPALVRELAVISTKLLAGRTILHVYAETAPGRTPGRSRVSRCRRAAGGAAGPCSVGSSSTTPISSTNTARPTTWPGHGPRGAPRRRTTARVVEAVLNTANTPITYLIIAVYAGELVWTERDVGLSEIAEVGAVPADGRPTRCRNAAALEVRARKMRADSVGNETEVPMDDFIEIGVFAPGDGLGDPLHLERHRIRSGEQTIRITVPHEPARAGVDPYGKLIDRERDDNVVRVEIAGATALSSR